MSEKKSFKETKFGKFLYKAGDVIQDNALDVAGIALKAATGNFSGAVEDVQEMLSKEGTSEANKLANELAKNKSDFENELTLLGMILKDKESARNMQNTALQQGDKFSKQFIYWFAIGWSVIAGVYIFWVTFGDVPEANIRHTDTLLGFLMGTIISTIIAFFFGSSKGSMDKQDFINKNS
jgi:hypothetical protein